MVDELKEKVTEIMQKCIVGDYDIYELTYFHERIPQKKDENEQDIVIRIRFFLKALVGKILHYWGLADEEDLKYYNNAQHLVISIRTVLFDREYVFNLKKSLVETA
jgi:hypothetical protein